MKRTLAAFACLIASPLLEAAPPNEGIWTVIYPGSRTIAAIQDRPMTMPGSLFRSIDPGETFEPADSYRASLNVFLIRDEPSGRHALIDAGYGKADSRLLERLAELNLRPEEISAVFITHIHPDHVGGLTTPEGRPAFPNAKIFIARKEYEEWRKDASRAALARHLTPNLDRLVLLEYDREVAPFGITPLYFPGHTPGHTVFEMKVESGGETVVLARSAPGYEVFKVPVAGDRKVPDAIWFVGDIVHAAELQIPHPEFCARFDKDFETAVKSRRKLLESSPIWLGAHLPFPGVVAIDWQPEPR